MARPHPAHRHAGGNPCNDVVVVVPGLMGSTLQRNRTPVWAPTARAALEALRSLSLSVKELQLPDGIGDHHPNDGVEPVALMPDLRLPCGLWTYDLGYTTLLRSLELRLGLNRDPVKGPINLIEFPYDWRLSNRYNAGLLGAVAERALERWRSQEGRASEAKLILVCHSMGGLLARWYLDRLGGAGHTRALITIGTPHRGALGALDHLVNGIQKGPPGLRLDLTATARSLPSLYQLLPEYACIETAAGLAKTTELRLPELDSARTADAMSFHTELDQSRRSELSYTFHPIGGFAQSTITSARLTTGLEPLTTIEANHDTGDGTVPRLACIPPDINPAGSIPTFVADNHSGLVHNRAVLDWIEGIVTANPVVYRGPLTGISASVPDTLNDGERLNIYAQTLEQSLPLQARVTGLDQLARPPIRLHPTSNGLQLHAAVDSLPPGAYRITIEGAVSSGPQASPLTSLLTVWPRAEVSV